MIKVIRSLSGGEAGRFALSGSGKISCAITLYVWTDKTLHVCVSLYSCEYGVNSMASFNLLPKTCLRFIPNLKSLWILLLQIKVLKHTATHCVAVWV